MKINDDFIKKIFNLKLELKKKDDKIKVAHYQDLIPMFDVYTERVYPIQRKKLYKFLMEKHYRFIDEHIYQWINDLYKKYKGTDRGTIHKNNLSILDNYDIETLRKTSFETLYKYSEELGLAITICKRESFNKYASHLTPYYTKMELKKLGLNMGLIKDGDINLDNILSRDICVKVSHNDISYKEIEEHTKYIIDNNLISVVAYYSLFGSYLMNQYLRNEDKSYYFSTDMINKLALGVINAPELKNDYYLYRLVKDDDYLNELDIGDEFLDDGFMSTTRDPFYSPGVDKQFGLILLKIKIPKGVKGVGLLMENFSLFPGEQEFLMAPRTVLRLKKKDNKFKYYHIDKKFEKLITKKYEFEYVENNYVEIEKMDIDCSSEKLSKSIKGKYRTNLFTKFIQRYKINSRQICFTLKNKKYIMEYNHFEGDDVYRDFFYNDGKGLLLSIYDNDYPYLNIEMGKEMVINHLNQVYYYDKRRLLNYEDIQMISNIGKMFGYSYFLLMPEYNNFCKFSDSNYGYTKLYNKSIYDFFKDGTKFYSYLGKLDKYMSYEYGYWKLKKVMNEKVYFNYHLRFKIEHNIKTLGELFIYIVENSFEHYKELMEILNEDFDFNMSSIKFNIEDYLEEKITPIMNSYEDSDEYKDYELVFGDTIRRIR